MLIGAVELVVVRGGIQLRRSVLCVVSREDGERASKQVPTQGCSCCSPDLEFRLVSYSLVSSI